MRCLTLAEHLRSAGGNVKFACRELTGNLNAYISDQRRFEVVSLSAQESSAGNSFENKYDSWLRVSWQEDASECTQWIRKLNFTPDWLIVDHYVLDEQWQSAMRPHSHKIAVIDDLANRKHDCDLFIDPNYFRNSNERYSTFVSKSCIQLLGPRYALIGAEYLEARKLRGIHDGQIRNVLVYFGGTDSSGATIKVLDALEERDFTSLSIHVVIGLNNPYKYEIARRCQKHKLWRHYGHLDNMAQLMLHMDLVIGAGGATTWERSCLGIPGLIVTIAPNQEVPAQEMAEDGLQFLIGRNEDVTPTIISNALLGLLHQHALIRYVSRNVGKLVDGHGVDRVVRRFLDKKIILRSVCREDQDNIYTWRNHENNRRFATDPSPISYDKHRKWFNNLLNDNNKALLIAEYNNDAIGVLRFDVMGNEALVSIYLVPGFHGKGWGSEVIHAGLEWIKINRPEIVKITANIKPQNTVSIKVFEQAGFEHTLSSFEYEIHAI